MPLLLFFSLKAHIYEHAVNFLRADFPSALKWKQYNFLCILNNITSSLVTLHKRCLCTQHRAVGGPFYGRIKQAWPSCFFTAEGWSRNPVFQSFLSPPQSPHLNYFSSTELLTTGPHLCYLLLNTTKIFYISSAGSWNSAEYSAFPQSLLLSGFQMVTSLLSLFSFFSLALMLPNLEKITKEKISFGYLVCFPGSPFGFFWHMRRVPLCRNCYEHTSQLPESMLNSLFPTSYYLHVPSSTSLHSLSSCRS